jgi:hypothetical protein
MVLQVSMVGKITLRFKRETAGLPTWEIFIMRTFIFFLFINYEPARALKSMQKTV